MDFHKGQGDDARDPVVALDGRQREHGAGIAE